MQALKIGVVSALTIFAGLSALGTGISKTDVDFSPVSDAKATLRMALKSPTISEVHFFPASGVVCGLVKHGGSTAGATPFAYSRSLGLSVTEVWGRDEPEKLNRQYGCEFLPVAYVAEWKTRFWGTSDGDVYAPEAQRLVSVTDTK